MMVDADETIVAAERTQFLRLFMAAISARVILFSLELPSEAAASDYSELMRPLSPVARPRMSRWMPSRLGRCVHMRLGWRRCSSCERTCEPFSAGGGNGRAPIATYRIRACIDS